MMRGTRTTGLALLIGCAVVVSGPGSAQADPRAMAMGGTDIVISNGADAIGANPALLSLPGGPSMSLRLVQAGGMAANNSFNLDQYRRLNGASWDEQNKQELLGSVPVDGLHLDALASGTSGFTLGSFGALVCAEGAGSSGLSRDAVDLVLYGNALGRTYVVSGSSGKAMAGGRVFLGLSHQVGNSANAISSLGLQVAVERGVRWEEAEALQGTFYASEDTAEVIGSFRYREGTRATGFSAGVGFARQAEHTRFSVMLRDVVSRLSWTGTERTYQVQGGHGVHGNADLDSAFTTQEGPAVPAQFQNRRSPLLSMGWAASVGRRTLALTLEKGLQESPGISTAMRVGAGLEQGVGPVALRGGASLGGGRGNWFSAGLGLHAGPLHMDLAAATRGFSPSAVQGVAGAAGASLEF